MIEKLKISIIKFFTQNLILKVSSLFLSIFLWFIVMNINNPAETKTFSVELTILNENILKENGILILNKEDLINQKIQVKVKGTRQALAELNKKENREQIVASLDLNQFKYLSSLSEADFFTANIEVNLPSTPYSYEISNINPINVSINFDKETTISKKLSIKKIGSLTENYISTDINLSSEYVQITGASSTLEKIESVFIEVDINNSTSDVETVVSPIAYDNSGNKIEDITFTPSEITVTAPIYSRVNIEVLEPSLKGSLPENYIITNISYNPTSFYIYVSQDIKNDIPTTISPTINVTNLTESKDYNFSINEFFEYEDIYYEAQNKITVSIEIEKEQNLDLTIDTNTIEINNILEDYNVEILEDEIIINLIGKEEDLSNINVNDIKASVSLEDLEIGENLVKVDFELPENIQLKEDIYINLVIDTKETENNEEDTIST